MYTLMVKDPSKALIQGSNKNINLFNLATHLAKMLDTVNFPRLRRKAHPTENII